MRLLAGHVDEQIRKRAKQLLGRMLASSRAEILKQYEVALERDGDRDRGPAVFKKVCAVCHQLQGVGHAIGPNLVAMCNRGHPHQCVESCPGGPSTLFK